VAIMTIVICILGSHSLHKVYGGNMLLIERVLDGTYFGWAQMLLTNTEAPIDLL
jgi:hypothetical protein